MPIIFDACGKVEEAKKNLCTLVGKEVCPSHVVKVWEAVSCFIKNQFCLGHGVRIPELATITYKIFNAELSQREVLVDKIPHILISKNVAKKYRLNAPRPPYNLDVPETCLNLSAIAEATGISRSAVEICINEVVQAFHRALVCDSCVEFHFPGIGRMIIQCGEVNVVFASNFMCQYGFGEDLITDKICAKILNN